MDVVNALAACVGQGHQVDLKEPELTIIAEICQVNKQTKKLTRASLTWVLYIEFMYVICSRRFQQVKKV